MMETLKDFLPVLSAVGSVICFVLVIIHMFRNKATTLGLVTLAMLLLCGLGGLLAFIVGWRKADEWQIENIMATWTVCVVIGVLARLML